MKNSLRRLQSGSSTSGAREAFQEGLETVAGANDEARDAFYTRAVRAAAILATQLPKNAVLSSLAEDNSIEALVTALAAADNLELHSVSHSFVRGIAAKRALLEAEGGTLTAPELEKAFGISRQHINVLRDQNKLLGLLLGSRVYRYPVWQFDEQSSRPLAGFERVMAALTRETVDGWSKLIFFLEPNDQLSTGERDEVTPLEALRSGRIEEVIHAASAWGA